MDGTLYYVHQDLLGSTVALSDAAGGEVGRVQYDPYGEVLTSTLPATLTDRLFTGQRFDSSTGLYYYNARYYDPYLGRFIQPDSLVPDPLNPQAWNRFTYVYNNPASFVDPSGHDPVTLLLLFIAGGALAGEGLYALHLHYTGEQANAGELLNWMAWGAFAGATVYMAPYMLGYGLSLAGMDAIGASIWLSRLGVSSYWLMYAGLWANNTGYFLQCTGWWGGVIQFGGSVAREAAIRYVLKQQGMEIPSYVESITYNPTSGRFGSTTPLGGGRTAITIGPKAFSSASQLASTLGHELEVHALQYFEEAAGIRVYDWAAWEMEAYGWEIENAYRTGLSGKEFEEVFQMWQQFRDLWGRHHGQ